MERRRECVAAVGMAIPFGETCLTFPSEPTRQACDLGQRRQGCAAPAGLDLDASARRGRMMAGRRCASGMDAATAAVYDSPARKGDGRMATRPSDHQHQTPPASRNAKNLAHVLLPKQISGALDKG